MKKHEEGSAERGMGTGPGYVVWMPDTVGLGDISPDVWREAPIDETDPTAVDKRDTLKAELFGIFFGTPEERAKYGPHCYPFDEMNPEAVERLPEALRHSYENELAVARDPRSGRIVRPYIPAQVVKKPEI